MHVFTLLCIKQLTIYSVITEKEITGTLEIELKS